ncbi:UNVERIFIED_CONTAM: hypothetical protein Sindi_1432800 [Sesamum indicum]
MSSSYHPQSDGQTERFNSMLEDYLRYFVRGTQKDWLKLLDVAQLCFNAQKSSFTNKSAFEIVTGQQPLLPHTLDTPQSVRSHLARSFSQEWKKNVDITRSCLETAQKRMKKYADHNRRFIELNAVDLVLVKVPDPRLSKSSRGRDLRLMQKCVGPLPVVRRIGTVVYKVELPSWWKIHNVFHRDHTEYLLKWRGCSSKENIWERVTNLKTLLPLVEAYHASIAPGTLLSQVGENVRAARVLGTLDVHFCHSTVLHDRPINLHRQTLDIRSLRVIGVGLIAQGDVTSSESTPQGDPLALASLFTVYAFFSINKSSFLKSRVQFVVVGLFLPIVIPIGALLISGLLATRCALRKAPRETWVRSWSLIVIARKRASTN